MVKILGLAGYARVGKTTAAQELKTVGYRPVSFAKALKAAVDPLFPPNTPKEVLRPVYVAYGCAWRQIQPGHWIDCVKADCMSGMVVLDDCRFADEVEWITSVGGRVVLIERPGVGPANEEEARSFAEIREQFTLPTVNNAGTVTDLARAVLKALEESPNVECVTTGFHGDHHQ